MTPDPASGRWLRALAIAAVIALGVVTCARREAAPGTGPRIVSIGGAVTEIIYALGAGDRVVAVDTSSVYPTEATHLPQLGYLRSLAAEAVLAQAPDLVIASADEHQLTVTLQTRQVPRAIEPLRALAERIKNNELLGGQFGAVAIASGDALPANTEFADDANRRLPPAGVKHADACVGYGPPDGDQAGVHYAADRRPDGRLGRPVHIPELANLAQ